MLFWDSQKSSRGGAKKVEAGLEMKVVPRA